MYTWFSLSLSMASGGDVRVVGEQAEATKYQTNLTNAVAKAG